MAAMQLMWTCGISASTLGITVLLSTRSPTSKGWTAELAVGCWLLAVGCWLLPVGCWLVVNGSDDGDSNPRE